MQLKLGTDNSFYMLLEGQAEVAHRAAVAFRQALDDFENLSVHAAKVIDIEHEGDDLTHKLQNHVASTFITPLDKEDLRDLSQTLDDITDCIEAVIARAKLYRLMDLRADLVPMADLMVKCTALVASAVANLKSSLHSEELKAKLTEIHTVENQSDELYRSALGELFFEPNPDPLYVIKWKEIYDRMEIAADKCEDIAKIVGTIVVKYA